MKHALRLLSAPIIVLSLMSCSGEGEPRNDTAVPDTTPPEESTVVAPRSTWNRAAGALFAIRGAGGSGAWAINPDYGETQALDTLVPGQWNVEGSALTLLEGGTVAGTGRLASLRFDSLCVGWPTATIVMDSSAAAWRVAFPAGTVDGIAFDSLPVLATSDSAVRARYGALAASRLPDDTATAFRGRPFIVRQASRFPVAADTTATMYEVVRLVAQEANPLQEQILIITEGTAGVDTATVFFRREIGVEESMGSIELLAVLRTRSNGRLALLLRREREAGFVLEWVERTVQGNWSVRWRSAIDSC